MLVFFWIIQIKEAVLEGLVVVVGIHDLKDGTLSRSWVALDPDVRVAVGFELVAFLNRECLDLFSVLEVVARELLEGFLVLSVVEHGAHLNEDVIQLSFLFFVATLDEFLLRGVFGHVAEFQ